MKHPLRLAVGVIATALGVFLAGSPAPAFASGTASAGKMVAMCAQMDLGARDGAPMVTCTCSGGTMTFANFGKMVQSMKETGCSLSCC